MKDIESDRNQTVRLTQPALHVSKRLTVENIRHLEK